MTKNKNIPVEIKTVRTLSVALQVPEKVDFSEVIAVLKEIGDVTSLSYYESKAHNPVSGLYGEFNQ